MNTEIPTFSRNDSMKFFRTLNARVNTYFKDNRLEKTGNWKLHLKTAIMFGLFFVPFLLYCLLICHFGCIFFLQSL